MNPKVHELMGALTRLPDDLQTEMAENFLEELAWQQSFAQPESKSFLEDLRLKAEIERKAGLLTTDKKYRIKADEKKRK